MATESLVRMVEGRRPGEREPSDFPYPLENMASEELGILLQGSKYSGVQRSKGPHRSGSAPPSMEGSFAAIENLLARSESGLSTSFENMSMENCETEEQLRSDPAYLAYYFANVNLNPRLPPPLVSRESRRLVRHIGALGNNTKLNSFDDGGDGSLRPRGFLSTHSEEPDEERSSQQDSNDGSGSGSAIFLPRQSSTSLSGRHKSLVDLIQEDFPRTPSPVYSQARVSNHPAAEEQIEHELSQRSLTLSDPSSHISPSPESNKGVKDCRDVYSPNKGAPSQSSASRMSEAVGHLRHESKESQNPQRQPSHQLNDMNRLQGFPAPPMLPDLLKFSSVDAQPQHVQHPPGLQPPLYASAAAYLNMTSPFYPSLQPPGLFPSQYGVGGFALSPPVYPYMAGYPPSNTISPSFNLSSGPNLNVHGEGGSGIPLLGEMQHVNKYYGHHHHPSLPQQPHMLDPIHLPYFQPPFDVGGGQYGHGTRSEVDAFNSHKAPMRTLPFVGDHRLHAQPEGSPRKGGGPPNMGFVPQYQGSPLSSPVMPGSPMGGLSSSGRRIDLRYPQGGGSRSSGGYSAWQGMRGGTAFDDSPRRSFLEELKSNSSRKFELSDVTGRIVEFSSDQHGSRFIQQKLESCSADEKAAVFAEVVPHASKLMTDVFGNYVIQKFFEHGTPDQKRELADQLRGQILPLSLQMYGCRVIQKALEVIEIDQKTQLVRELDGHVMRCVRDQNGNHVIQKCIECIPAERIGFIIQAFQGQVASLSTHPYGCRVIQRVLEHCSDELQSQCIVDEILESALDLAQDQYGNYVTQHVLERGKTQERSQIIGQLAGKIVQMSQHKYASNVVEKCLEHGSAADRERLIEEILMQPGENDSLLVMMKDQFANYVVQKILEVSTERHRDLLLSRIRAHLTALKKYTYGKHIVARFELLCGVEEKQISEQGEA
uniref:PUM-HD domain-containing protein n=1 Tax=Kalanchoe fedtschenkoi TaxID=63787 RepID=A0A7N0TYU2_KALFE